MDVKKEDLLTVFKSYKNWEETGNNIDNDFTISVLFNSKKNKLLISNQGDDFFTNNDPDDCTLLCFTTFNTSFDKTLKLIKERGNKIK